MSKVEYTALVSARAVEIAAGSEPLIQTTEHDPILIAIAEIRSGRCKLTIFRDFPNGKHLEINPTNANILH